MFLPVSVCIHPALLSLRGPVSPLGSKVKTCTGVRIIVDLYSIYNRFKVNIGIKGSFLHTWCFKMHVTKIKPLHVSVHDFS